MSAIGISPCPPFNRSNLIPPQLYDGNTVAWYKHNDNVAGVIKDGGNRVNVWLDKFNYNLGAEFVNQLLWYTLAYWNIANANWSQFGTTLISNGNNGNIYKDGWLTIGKTYKVEINCTITGGAVALVDLSTGLINLTLVDGNNLFYITPNAVRLGFQSVLFNGSINSFSIKEVTGKHLIQQTGANQPLWSAANGVLFDGVNDFMKATAFAFVQPEFIYFVGKYVTFTNLDNLFDGDADLTGAIEQIAPSPNIVMLAPLAIALNSDFILNTVVIGRFLFNGAASSIQINKNAITNGVLGANNMNNFTLGSAGSTIGGYGNIEVKEIILRKSADNANTQDAIYNYLKNANNV